MKYLGLVLFFAIAVVITIFIFPKDSPSKSPVAYSPSPTQGSQKVLVQKKYLFVPYWSFQNKEIAASEYDELIYFGIAADKNGINKDDLGYKKLSQFIKLSGNAKKLLTIRMIDSQINSVVLEDVSAQKRIIDQSIVIAKENGFKGIVLDFEISALAFDSVIKKITALHTLFSKSVKQSGLQFSATMYGDAFYRARPYDVLSIAKGTENLFLMTYDLHKARENPGPNFPIKGKDVYGYDLETMLTDFSKTSSREKLVVVLGLFGYDWTVDAKNQGVGLATSLSSLEIKRKFLDSECKTCHVKKDLLSGETKINYTDELGKQHIVWFEDALSAEKKKLFLKDNGVWGIGYWAYSYF